MTIYVIEYYRRVMDGREFCYSKLFSTEEKAKKSLLFEGYRLIRGEDILYEKGTMRAVITERSVE